MNISLLSARRIHWLRLGFPACGGGRHGKKGVWQLDIGEVTCQRCEKMLKKAAECPPNTLITRKGKHADGTRGGAAA
jgi:hypothetical protein